nr:F-box protein CPR30-like isoform X2 [Ipomoea trifida]
MNRALQTNSDQKFILRSSHVYVADFDELEQTNTTVYMAFDLHYKRSAFGTDILGSCHALLCGIRCERQTSWVCGAIGILQEWQGSVKCLW